MEPDKKETGEKIDQATLSSLKDEGIEIETGSRRTEENEFSPETGSVPATNQIDASLDEETKTILAEIAEPKNATVPTKKIPEIVAPVVQKQPQINTIPEIVIPRQNPSANDPSIHQLRTFKMDAEEAVKYQNISAADIAIAEQKKREATPIEYSSENHSKAPFIILLALIVFALLGAGAYFYLKTQSAVPVQKTTNSIRTILPYEKAVSVTGAGERDFVFKIADATKNVSGTVGTILFIALPETGTTTKQIPLALALAGTKAPDKLIRSLTNEYMFGIHVFDGSAPFIILKTSFFQNAFPGMLEWEKDMRNGLLPLIKIGHPNTTEISTNSDIFKDRVIDNKDVRELDDSSGNPIVLYTFVDKDTILITTNEKSLRELMSKLLVTRVIQ